MNTGRDGVDRATRHALDGAVVLTGSFNFTKSAESSNAENLLVIRDPKLAARYLTNWEEHKAHSEAYAGK